MHPETAFGRLRDRDHHPLAYRAGGGPDRARHLGMFRHGQLNPHAAGHMGVVRRRRGTERDESGAERQRQRHKAGRAGAVLAIQIGKKRIGACLPFAGPVMGQRRVHQRQPGAPVKL